MIGFDSSWQSVPLEMCRHFESSICYDRGAKSTDPCAADTIVPAQVVSIVRNELFGRDSEQHRCNHRWAR